MADYPESHVARVVDAVRRGPRITPSQLAKHHGVTRVTVWRWVRSGKLPKPQGRGIRARWWDFDAVREVKP